MGGDWGTLKLCLFVYCSSQALQSIHNQEESVSIIGVVGETDLLIYFSPPRWQKIPSKLKK